MQRITVALDDDLLDAIDTFAEQRGYQNRSEALRDVARAGLESVRADGIGSDPCVGAALYVYEHESRELARRVTRTFHAHHDLALATLHVHLDHESCLEIAVLKGAAAEVRSCAEQVIAERGVRHGRLVTFPAEQEGIPHRHRPGAPMHTHLKVKEA
jgi:CopG family nickel-responsive transcriptional regulator